MSQLLREADPIRLITIGAPDDEYDPEVSTILPRLREARSAADVQKIIYEEFVHWFDADIAGPITHYAEDLLRLLDWLTQEGCTHVASESTGVYWRPVFNILEGATEGIATNACDAKGFKARKPKVIAAER